jgi:hypothetical protein
MPFSLHHLKKNKTMKKIFNDYDAQALFGVALILAMMASIISMWIVNQTQ